MKIKYSDGRILDAASEEEAIEILTEEYPEMVTCENEWEPNNADGSEERLLVWRSEEESENDGGQNAVAEIIRTDES
jgi:hypothetical protein